MEEILRKLVAFRTITGDETAAHQALDYIAQFVTRRGMHVERFESNGFESLIATVRAGQKTPTVMLGGHIDVVPAPDELFELRESGGKLYGRGVMDMKFAIATYLQAIDDLGDKGKLTDYDLGLMITSDEEVGGFNGVAKLVEWGYVPKVCILPDGGENWQIQTSSNGFSLCKIVVRGVAAHGSRPWLADNPIDRLMVVLAEIKKLFPADPQPGMNTMSITNFTGGDGALTQIPDQAEAILDTRSRTEHGRSQLESAMQKICQKHDAELTFLVRGAAIHFSLDNPYIQPFVKLAEKYTDVRIRGSHAVAASDARYYVPYGTPCISFYPTGGGLHGAEEWIAAKSMPQFVAILKDYLELMARQKIDDKV